MSFRGTALVMAIGDENGDWLLESAIDMVKAMKGGHLLMEPAPHNAAVLVFEADADTIRALGSLLYQRVSVKLMLEPLDATPTAKTLPPSPR